MVTWQQRLHFGLLFLFVTERVGQEVVQAEEDGQTKRRAVESCGFRAQCCLPVGKAELVWEVQGPRPAARGLRLYSEAQGSSGWHLRGWGGGCSRLRQLEKGQEGWGGGGEPG